MADLFQGEAPSLQDMLGCARRELAMRKKVYPSWVARGRMSQEQADRETSAMAAIVAHFEKAAGRG